MVSNWESAYSLVEEASLRGRDWPLSALAVASCLSASGRGEEPVCSQLALLWYSLNPLFCEWGRLCIRLEPFMGKCFFSVSGYPTVRVAISC